MNKFLRFFVVLFAVSIVLSSCGFNSSSEVDNSTNNTFETNANTDTNKTETQQKQVEERFLKPATNKKMKFGTQAGKPISWYVIYEDDEHKILFSEKVLDAIEYNKYDTDVDWGNSTLHEYLNSDFVNDYFSDDEREQMVFTNDVDYDLVTMATANNIRELFGEIYYLEDGYYGDKDFYAANKKIIAKPTETAINNDIYPFDNKTVAEIEQKQVDKRYNFANGAVPYWLLDQNEKGQVYTVTATGYVEEIDKETPYIGIRPIIRIKKYNH